LSSAATLAVLAGALVALLALALVHLRRHPQRMPAFVLNLRARRLSLGGGAVAFENPGYDSDGKVGAHPHHPLT